MLPRKLPMKYFCGILSILCQLTFYGQHQDKVDFTRATINIGIDPLEKSIKGSVTYDFTILKDVDSVFLDAHDMVFESVRLKNKKVAFTNTGKTISIRHPFKAGKSYVLALAYKAHPKQTVYFVNWPQEMPSIKASKGELINGNPAGSGQVWTQGQGKYTSHWLPSFDDMNEKVEFDLSIAFNPKYEVVANGKLLGTSNISDGGKLWRFDMQHPMSSYLLAFAIGAYEKQTLESASGIPIENYYYPTDRHLVEPTYRYSQEIFNFLEREIGVAYPWQNYKQLPVKDFPYAGMENTGTTLFSDSYVIDSIAFVDKNYINVNAHELAHQWFGNLVTEVDANHHWLHEGFATYYAYLAEKELFGEEHYHWKLYDSFIALKNIVEAGKGQSLLDPKASSLIFYEKGAWALHMLREQIGDKAFKMGIRSFLEQYRFKNATVSDFLSVMEAVSAKDLMGFKKEWLENTEMPTDAMRANLMANSTTLTSLFQLQDSLETTPVQNIDLEKFWENERSVDLREYILIHYDSIISPQIIESAFKSNEIPLRRALAVHGNATKLPKPEFESLLCDNSYVTIENALFQLWAAYPEQRAQYLDKTKNIVGLPNKNVRQLWLTLAVLTNGYDGPNTKIYFDELCGYTDPRYSFEVRQIAFRFLKEAFGFTDATLLNLMVATSHYSWQFRDFARRLLDELLEDEVYKQRLVALSSKLKPEEKRYLQTKLNQP